MRRPLGIITGLLVALAGTGLAQADEPERSISVTGTAVAKTAPDHIVWRISLQDFDKDLRAAKRRNDESVKAVLALCGASDIAKEDMETSQVRIRREYERGEHGERGRFKHFVVYRSVTVRQRDMKRFDEFLDRLVGTSDMEVDFSFESSKIHEVRAETRLKALAVAKDKAAAMAEVVGAKLGRVLTIQEHAADRSYRLATSNVAFTHSPPPVDVATERFVPGAITVQISVYATFELQ